MEGRSIGRYVLFDRIASGGMAQVHLGRLVGAAGFARTVAIKRLLPHCATDAEIVPMFVDEARLAARIRHPNVVSTLDVVQEGDELLLVMEYVHGESLSRLASRARMRGEGIPIPIASAILVGVLEGLHAAHEAKSERGDPLNIVHRDVSPQNILVGVDGVARVVDFGIAKARGRVQTTRDGQLKGKAGYVGPEQLLGDPIDRRLDVYAASVVLWEILAGRRLFEGDGAPAVMRSVLEQRVAPPSTYAHVPRALDDLVLRGLSRSPSDRFATAREMAAALEHIVPPAAPRDVETWVATLASDVLAARAELLDAIENDIANPIGHVTRGKPSDDIATAPLSGTPSVSLAVDRPPERPKSRSSFLLFGIGAVLAASAAFVVLRDARPPEAALTPVASSAPEVALSVVPSAEPPKEPPPASVTPSHDSAPVKHPPIAKPPPKHKASAVPPNCQVPFTRAPDGTKIPKPECF